MSACNVKKFKWIPVTDWNELTQTYSTFSGVYVGENDVDNFVENVFRDVSRQLNMNYSELEKILVEENHAFFETKSRVFKNTHGYSKDHSQVIGLQKMLRIPDVSAILSDKPNIEKILNDFSSLTDIEKIEILQRLGTISVNIEFITK